MSKQTYNRQKPNINIGTVGHVDHGKTTLTAAIMVTMQSYSDSAVKKYDEIDKAPEEKQRGITINSATVEYETEKYHYSHTDCPGHQDFIKNMITGAAQMDAAVLVVGGTDGVMPQTKEHILLLKQLGINTNNLFVVINKADLVEDAEMIELVKMEVSEELEARGFVVSDHTFVELSALKALEGDATHQGHIKQLFDNIEANMVLPERKEDAPFRMKVGDVFSIQGRGTVAAGKIDQGSIKIGEKVQVVGLNVPEDLITTVTGVQTFNKDVEVGLPGDNIALLLRGIEKGVIPTGATIATPGSAKEYTKVECEVYLLTKDEGGRHTAIQPGYRPHAHVGPAGITVTIRDMKDEKGGNLDMAMPGDKATMTIEFEKKAVLEKGVSFTLRESNKTIGAAYVVGVVE